MFVFFVFMIFGEDKAWSHYRIDPSFASWTFIVIVHQPSTQCKLGATFLDNFCTFLHPTTFSEISTSDLDKNVKTSIASTNWEWNPWRGYDCVLPFPAPPARDDWLLHLDKGQIYLEICHQINTFCTFTSRMQSNRNTSAHFLDFLAVLLLANWP